LQVWQAKEVKDPRQELRTILLGLRKRTPSSQLASAWRALHSSALLGFGPKSNRSNPKSKPFSWIHEIRVQDNAGRLQDCVKTQGEFLSSTAFASLLLTVFHSLICSQMTPDVLVTE